jgi:hypothetical protein
MNVVDPQRQKTRMVSTLALIERDFLVSQICFPQITCVLLRVGDAAQPGRQVAPGRGQAQRPGRRRVGARG